jgi:hypothetical protein
VTVGSTNSNLRQHHFWHFSNVFLAGHDFHTVYVHGWSLLFCFTGRMSEVSKVLKMESLLSQWTSLSTAINDMERSTLYIYWLSAINDRQRFC